MSEAMEGEYVVKGLIALPEDQETLAAFGLKSNEIISNQSGVWKIGEREIDLDSSLASSILLSRVGE